eukprot:g33240.t1
MTTALFTAHTLENQITVFLLPAYKQTLKQEDLSHKGLQCWSEAVEDHLWNCLDSVDWTAFKCSVENLDEYTTTIMNFMSKCMEAVDLCMFPNHKPWMNQETHSLQKTRHAAFKLSDPEQYRKSRYELRKAIRKAKRQCQTKLEAQTYQTDSRCQWNGLNNMTGYKLKQSKIADKDTSLPDALNGFYARFHQNGSGAVTPALTAPDTPVPLGIAADVRS